jgi:hypothetical protein
MLEVDGVCICVSYNIATYALFPLSLLMLRDAVTDKCQRAWHTEH